MKLHHFILILVAAAVVVAAISPAAMLFRLDDNTFNPEGSSGDWDVPGHWTLDVVPTTSHRAIIPQGKTCNVVTENPLPTAGAVLVQGTLNIAQTTGKLDVVGDMIVTDNITGGDGLLTVSRTLLVGKELKVDNGARVTVSVSNTVAQASHINVRDGGLIQVETGATLRLTDVENTRSEVLATVEVAGTLDITDNHTILGDSTGDIKLINGKIGTTLSPATRILTIEGVGPTRAGSLTVHGYGTIHVALMNKAFVVADENVSNQYLYLATNAKDSTTAGHWMAEGGSNSTLYALCESEVKGGGWWELIDLSDVSAIRGRIYIDSCCDELTGEVVNKNGEICIINGFCTTGDLTLKSVAVSTYKSEPYIHVRKAAAASFSPGTCSGTVCFECPE